jgi:hypothetical protein
MRIYAAVAQKERELISERTRAALGAAKARGAALGGDRRYRPSAGPDSRAAAVARRDAAMRAAHQLPGEGVISRQALARALTARGVLAPRGGGTWTHTTVGRLLARMGAQSAHCGRGTPAGIAGTKPCAEAIQQ